EDPPECCGHVGAVKGAGQVAGVNALGAINIFGPNSVLDTVWANPGLRNAIHENVSVKRRRSKRCTVTPPSAEAIIRCGLAVLLRVSCRSLPRKSNPRKFSFSVSRLVLPELYMPCMLNSIRGCGRDCTL